MKRLMPLAVVVAALAFSAPAQASWGDGECYWGVTTGHCYAITSWEMEGGQESVKGATFVPTTTLMNVQEWASGGRVNDEGWLRFKNSGGWLEAGQSAGYLPNEQSCCTLHAFIAHAIRTEINKAGKEVVVGYEEYAWPGVAEPRNVYRIEDPAANGTWCEYIWNNEVDCKNKGSYWPAYSDFLQAGIEAIQNTRPENSGSQEVNFITHSGEARAWGGANTQAEGFISPGPDEAHELCETPNWASNYPGNADWTTC
jgi:hypothetical protein